jgi:hypothetical protein
MLPGAFTRVARGKNIEHHTRRKVRHANAVLFCVCQQARVSTWVQPAPPYLATGLHRPQQPQHDGQLAVVADGAVQQVGYRLQVGSARYCPPSHRFEPSFLESTLQHSYENPTPTLWHPYDTPKTPLSHPHDTLSHPNNTLHRPAHTKQPESVNPDTPIDPKRLTRSHQSTQYLPGRTSGILTPLWRSHVRRKVVIVPFKLSLKNSALTLSSSRVLRASSERSQVPII